MEIQEYTVKTSVFEGPLELLLSLVEKRKLFINDISLATVTDDYIEHINKQNEASMTHTADFILIASTLLLIKSKSLLPALSLTDEEEKDIDDLETRLKLYKKIKELSRHIDNNFGKNIIFAKSPSRLAEPIFSPHKKITIANIAESVQNVLKNLPKKAVEAPKAIVEKVMSLEDMIDRLAKRISGNLKMSFNKFSEADKKDRINIIVSFLAMLELVKQGTISVTQDSHFSDITMESDNISVPKYN